jgi:hypothetical protein
MSTATSGRGRLSKTLRATDAVPGKCAAQGVAAERQAHALDIQKALSMQLAERPAHVGAANAELDHQSIQIEPPATLVGPGHRA